MKYHLRFIALITLALIITACSNSNDSQNENNDKQAEKKSIQDDKYYDPEAFEQYDFRKAKWGMSMQEVRESENTEPVLKSDNALDYNTYLLGMQAQVGYTFNNDELVRAGFFFLTKLDSNKKYIDKYEEIKEQLITVNGEPVIDAEQSIDPSKTFTEEEKGDAVCRGDLLYAAQWDLPNTDIQLVLRGDETGCKLTVLYLSEEGVRQLMKQRINQE